MKFRAVTLTLAALLLVPAVADAAWTAVPPAYTGNQSAALFYNDQGTLTEYDMDTGLPGNVWHARSRPAGGVFGADFELPLLLPLSATRPDGTEALIGMNSSNDVQTALRGDAATSFTLTDEHSTSQTYPPAGISVASSGAGLAEWVDSAGHVQVAGLPSAGSAFAAPTAALPGNPVQPVTFLSVVHPVLDPSGAAALTWATSSDGVHYQLEQSTRASAAGAFAAATAVGPEIKVEPQLTSNRSGVGAAVWWNPETDHVEVAVRRPGSSFGGAAAIGTPSGSFDESSLQTGVMGDGTVVVLWRDYTTGPSGTCSDGGLGTTLHVETLQPGGSWQATTTGSTEYGLPIGYQTPVLAVSQSTFAVATVLAEGQGTAKCGAGTKRVYAWQGAPGTFDGNAWALLPDQTTSDDSVGPAIGADAQGDVTVTWLAEGDRYEATTGAAGGGGAGGGGTGGGAGGDESPQRFGSSPAPKGASGSATTPADNALTVPTVTVIAFNVGLGRPETIEMPITCASSTSCNIIGEAAIRLLWGTLRPRAYEARTSGRAKTKMVALPLPKVRLQLAAHARGKLAIKVPKATMKRLEALLRTKGAKATLAVKLRVNGVSQRHSIATTLRIKQAGSKQ